MCPRPRPSLRAPPTPPTPPPPPTASPGERRAALASHRSLAQSLANIQRALKNGSIDAVHLESLLSTATSDLGTLGDYLSASIEPQYYNEIIPSTSTAAAERTFAVPELFESILDYVPIPSILAFSQTCRDYHSRIQHSAHLQTTLCLRAAAPLSHFRAPFTDCLLGAPRSEFYCRPATRGVPELLSRSTDGTGSAELGISAAFFPRGPEQRLPRVGSTYRRMFLTQPPITKLNPTLHSGCCSRDLEPLHCESGITIGDLHDYYQEMIQKHRLCPKGTRRALIVESGQNRVQISFLGNVTLGDRDPIVLRSEKAKRRREEKEERETTARRKAAAYLEQKWLTHVAGEPIPTMPQWLANNPNWDSGPARPVRQPEIPIDAFSFN